MLLKKCFEKKLISLFEVVEGMLWSFLSFEKYEILKLQSNFEADAFEKKLKISVFKKNKKKKKCFEKKMKKNNYWNKKFSAHKINDRVEGI